jgi:pyridoxal phosphate enzyme (YggS family)
VTPAEIAGRAAEVRRRISGACDRAGRDPSSVSLVAVTKTHPASTVRAAVEAGLTDFGENRVQEGVEKMAELAGLPGLKWRMIGRLQTNKVRAAVNSFQEIQSVDRLELVGRIAREAQGRETPFPVLVEVNLGGEDTKGGVEPEGAEALLREALAATSLRVEGLMAVPPFREDPEESRPQFRRLRELAESLRQRTGSPLPHLSMGMSHDFEVAVEEGATIVRVGTALFGTRASV